MANCKAPARKAFLELHSQVTDEMVRIIDENPNDKGVAQLKSYLESKKPLLREKFEAGKGFDLSSSDKDNYAEVLTANFTKLSDLKKRNEKVLLGHTLDGLWQLDAIIKDFQTFMLRPEK